MSKKKYETVAHRKADELLAEIAEAKADLSDIENRMEQCFEGVRLAFKKDFDGAKERAEVAEKNLSKLMKKGHSDLFGTGDDERTDLPAGALLFKRFLRLVRSRSVTVELLEAEGHNKEVKIAKSVDWDGLDKWSDVKLANIGAARKSKTSYEYEIKESAD